MVLWLLPANFAWISRIALVWLFGLCPYQVRSDKCIGHSPWSNVVPGKMERRARGCGSGLLSCSCDVGNLLYAQQALAGSSGALKVCVAPA